MILLEPAATSLRTAVSICPFSRRSDIRPANSSTSISGSTLRALIVTSIQTQGYCNAKSDTGQQAAASGAGPGRSGFRFRDGIAFAGSEEHVLIESMLPGVHIPIAPVQSEELLVGASFHDVAVFDHQNLIGPANGGQAMGNDKGGAPLHQVGKAFLNHGFR